MADSNLDAANLAAVARGGIINEDVMQAIWDISNVPLEFTDRLGTADNVENQYTSWVEDKLADPDLNNAKVDGQDITDNDERPAGPRVGNHCQISTKRVNVSTRANEVNTIGYASERARQIAQRQVELRRDVEAIRLSNQGSTEDDGSSTAGRAASVFAWLTSNIDIPGDATAGGYNTGTGLCAAYQPGTRRNGTLKQVKDVVEEIYVDGGNSTVLMSVPQVIRGMNEYMFDSSAQIATLGADTDADSGTGQMTGKGSVNVFIADHGQVLQMISNRVQQTHTATGGAAAHMGVFDFSYLRSGMLHGYRSEPQGRTGLSTKDQLSVDWTTKVLSEPSQGFIGDLQPDGTWTST